MSHYRGRGGGRQLQQADLFGRERRTTFQELFSFVTCSSGSSNSSSNRDLSVLGSQLFNCGASSDRCSHQHSSNSTKESTPSNMQRASVSRRTDSTPLSSGPRSRSSERYVEEHIMNENDNNIAALASDNVTANMEKPSSNDLYRSMSDPFDTAHGDDNFGGTAGTASDDDDDIYYVAASTSQISIHNDVSTNRDSRPMDRNSHPTLQIPTFSRYPCTESKNKNCWSEPPIAIFHVRGMNYCTDQKKVPSQPYLLRSRGSDIFLTDPKKPFTLDAIKNSIMGGQLLKLPTLAVIFRFPWGYMNLYFEIPNKLSKYMNDDSTKSNTPTMDSTFSIAEVVFAKWLLGDTTYKNERLKLIPYVAEGPWVVRNMVTGRPAIIGKKLPVTYHLSPATPDGKSSPLLMATLDIGNSSATAKRIVSVCRRYMSALTVDIGFVIQGDTPTELPEQMLGAMRIHGPDPLKAPKLN